MPVRLCFSALLSSLFVFTLHAQAPPVTKTVTVTLTPPKNSAPDFSGEPLVIEHSSDIYRYNADGTGERITSATILFQSLASVRALGVLSFNYASGNESIELRSVEVHKPDGTVIATTKADTQDLPTEVTRQAPLYSDSRQLQIPVRGLNVGDRLHYEIVVHVLRTDSPGEFWGAESFATGVVALDQNVELRFPGRLKVFVQSPSAKYLHSDEGAESVYRWHGSQTTPTTTKKNDDTPTPPKLIPDIGWTTFPDWSAVGAWYRTLAADRAIPDASIEAKAAALTAGATTDEEKIRRIYAFVAEQIRYVGLDFGIGRFQPHAASTVLANGYGDCKDKHTLLQALLAAAGIHAEPVLIGAGVNFDRDLPAPNSFNHLITALERPGQPPLFLDATAEIGTVGILTAPLRDKDALLVSSTAPSSLVKTPATLPFTVFDRFNGEGSVDTNGKLTAHYDVTVHSDWEVLLRAALVGAGKGEWQQVGQVFSQAMGYGGTVTSFEASNLTSTDTPLHYTYSYERENFGDWQDHRTLAMLPPSLFSGLDTSARPADKISLGNPRIETSHTVLSLPAGYTLDPPKPTHLHSSFGDFQLTYALSGNKLTTNARLEITKSSLPLTTWDEYKGFFEAVNTQSTLYLDLREGEAAQAATVASDKPFAEQVGSSPGTAPSPTAELWDTDAQSLLKQAYMEIQGKNFSDATTHLEAAKQINPKQEGLHSAYAILYFTQAKYPEAEAACREELALHPDNLPNLQLLLATQLKQKHIEDQLATLKLLRKAEPKNASWVRTSADLLVQQKRYEEAISLLASTAIHDPSNKYNIVALGLAQLAAGRNDEAQITLDTALEGAVDPGLLNNAAYELSDHGLAPDEAAKSATQALSILEKQTASLSLDHVGAQDLSRQNLLSAVWDTIGYIRIQQGKPAEAEPLLLAAWKSSQHAEVGYHLGLAYEKQGKLQQAFDTYRLALAARDPDFHREDDLQARHVALAKQLARSSSPGDAKTELSQQRMLTLPLLTKQQTSADFFVVVTGGKITATKFIEGDPVLSNAASALRAALAKSPGALPIPPGSGATILRRGALACSTLLHNCQFVLYLVEDTRLAPPDAKTAPSAEEAKQ